MSECFFRQLVDAGPCDGALVRCHLIDKQAIRRAFPNGAVLIDGHWQPHVEALFLKDQEGLVRRTLKQLQDDERAWVPGCGGLVGLSGHHGQFDGLRVALTRDQLPSATEEYATELGLTWWLERTYGPRAVEAA